MPMSRCLFASKNVSGSRALRASLLLVGVSALVLAQAGRVLAQGSPKPEDSIGAQCIIPAKQLDRTKPSEFRQISDYFLVINEQRVAAEIYQSESPFAALVVSASLPAPALFMADSVSAVKPEKMGKRPNGVVTLTLEGVGAQQGTYKFVDDEVQFTFQGRKGALRMETPLLGLRRGEEVTSHNPEYVALAASYAPSAPAVGALKKEQRAVTVRVYYGSWCGHCRKLVPHAVKLEQTLKGGTIRFEYLGLADSFTSDPEIKKLGVQSIPTGIVYMDGREVGRLVGDETWNALESALQGILKQMAPNTGSR